mmetsp:Transcript_1677/g.2636  ORF Transcript_1677/g.2636 Transcript_1677/m.2636 type:complete len:305 (-) Transcript_1677:1079-1993(-)
MQAARRLLQVKNRLDVPMYAGSSEPIVDPNGVHTSTWVLDDQAVKVFDADNTAQYESRGSCTNSGVRFMRDQLSSGPVTILMMGPMTDVSCLLFNYPEVIDNVTLVALAGQAAHSPVQLNGKLLRDFNIYMDPVAAAYVISLDVKLTIFPWELTSIASKNATAVKLTRDTLLGSDKKHTSTESLNWILPAITARNKFWGSIVDSDFEGPFDNFLPYYILYPSQFTCQSKYLYVQQCDSGECAPGAFTTGQLFYASTYSGHNLNGTGRFSGTIAATRARKHNVCVKFANESSLHHFNASLVNNTY